MDAFCSSSQELVAQNSKGKSKKKEKMKKDTTKYNPNPLANPPKGKDSLESTKSASKTKKKSSETYSFCGKDGHFISRCWKCLEALEETMKEHHISAPQSSSPLQGKVMLFLLEL